MQTETLTQLKQQIVSLDKREKQNLAEFLAEELSGGDAASAPLRSDDAMLEWLKANREKYAGRYVSLIGDRLVGDGETLREAREKAEANGCPNAFTTIIYSETDAPFGGW